MRFTFALLLTAMLSTAALADASKPVRLFILAGQSNMKNLNPALSFTPAHGCCRSTGKGSL